MFYFWNKIAQKERPDRSLPIQASQRNPFVLPPSTKESRKSNWESLCLLLLKLQAVLGQNRMNSAVGPSTQALRAVPIWAGFWMKRQ